MRDKEVIQDYRFMPEPDLPALRLSSNCSDCDASALQQYAQICINCALKNNLKDQILTPKLRQSLVFEHQLTLTEATVLVRWPQLLHLFLTSFHQFTRPDQRISNLVIVRKSYENTIRRELVFWLMKMTHFQTDDHQHFRLVKEFCNQTFYFPLYLSTRSNGDLPKISDSQNLTALVTTTHYRNFTNELFKTK
ncbi:hypothetical protein Ciccas_001219 [Cichlidogyrus casuarinus]|uniref:Uncharacterized protein n=1 Tax=Cichlidogyrus casuarinus TaxID=1844966 RepID=A0ABD2QNQ7_9PLAT